MPAPVTMQPGGCFHVRDLVDHPNVPAGGVYGPVMEPAHQHTVVCVGWAAFGSGGDVVDLAPGGGNGAAGDDAPAITERDRPALGWREAALLGAELDDRAIAVESHVLSAASADHLVHCPQRERHGFSARAAEGYEARSVTGLQVVGTDGDQHSG